jgi:hypothetical protein
MRNAEARLAAGMPEGFKGDAHADGAHCCYGMEFSHGLLDFCTAALHSLIRPDSDTINH